VALFAMLAWVPASCPLVGQSPATAAHDLTDHGTFEIYSAGKSIGTETFDIHVRSDRIEAQGDGQLQVEQNGKTIAVQTSSNYVLDSRLNPISYTWSQKGSQSSRLSIDFRSKPARVRYKQVNGQEDRKEFKLDQDVVVLDDNEIHHYELAIARYNQAKGGPQVLSGFTPQEALPGVIILNYVGPEQTTLNGDKVTLQHFALAAELTQINLWADDQGRLQLLSTADLQFQAMRKKETGK
jgi:hypothetical protein